MSQQRIIWLASFPKSGNTWMRSLLANYFMPAKEAPGINELRKFTLGDVRQDFFDKAAGEPYKGSSFDDWLQIRPQVLRLLAEARPGNHFVKTHCQILRIGPYDIIPPGLTAGALYMMRNPFDVAGSYARHLGMDLDSTIERMMDEKSVNRTPTLIFEVIGRWDRHVESWLDAPGLPRHVVRYEDMVTDTEASLRQLLQFLQAPVDHGKLRRAIRASSFKSLKKQEDKEGFRERPQEMTRFFHSGKAGGWRETLTPAQVGRIREAFLPVLERHYPEMLDETEEFAGGS